MWCDKCKKNVFAENEKCPDCGSDTQPLSPVLIYWCDNCKVPILNEIDPDKHKENCPICDTKIKYLCKDLRPVFPEERLLVESILDKPFAWKDKSVWVNDSRYYVDGKPIVLNINKILYIDIDPLKKVLSEYEDTNDYQVFNEYIDLFIRANQKRLNDIKSESFDFIRKVSLKYRPEQLVVSFSGGKDSTVVDDLATRALSNPSLIRIFCDTTLEFSYTHDYVSRFRRDNPKAIIKTAKNKEQDFYKVCEDIGPPARMLRWCCTMFKTGPITRSLNSSFKDEQVMSFYGIRKAESASRKKYTRLNETIHKKIQKQNVSSPILYWMDIEIWLYILGEKIDFNDAYRLGYDRVGCWCCPNNSMRAQMLSRIYMPEQSMKWREFLIDFAKTLGKTDPAEYVDSGGWKARQGGKGIASSGDVIIRFTNCTAEDNAKIYNLNKPISENFYNLFVPFGKVSMELGRKALGEVLVLDIKTNTPIISMQPFNQQGYDYPVKIRTMNVSDNDNERLQRQIAYQVKKFNACRKCLKCESVCTLNAIKISGNDYKIDDKICVRCRQCLNPKLLSGGCHMDKFLKTRKDGYEN